MGAILTGIRVCCFCETGKRRLWVLIQYTLSYWRRRVPSGSRTKHQPDDAAAGWRWRLGWW